MAEFLPAAAKSIGAPVFAPAFLQHHLPHLLSKTQPVNPASVRAIVLGALAEATEAMGAAMAPGAAHVVQAAVREMNGEEDDDECVRHAAFLAGVTVAACPGECAGAVPRLLEALEAVLARKKGRGRDAKAARDNALGAVCRIAASEAGQGLPLGVIVRGVVGGEALCFPSPSKTSTISWFSLLLPSFSRGTRGSARVRLRSASLAFVSSALPSRLPPQRCHFGRIWTRPSRCTTS